MLGIALLVVWGAVRAESIINAHAALRKFNVFDSPGLVLADSAPERDTSPARETVLNPWDERNAQTHSESSPVRSDVPLAVLRIPKIPLEVLSELAVPTAFIKSRQFY